jgi:small subunit ribosomal protein S5
MTNPAYIPQEDKKYEEQVLLIRRVTKKTTGGNYVTFSALVVIGDRKGNVGVGLGNSKEVPAAIQKSIANAKKNLIHVSIKDTTLPHAIKSKFKAAEIILKPAPKGTGLKVGSVTRPILDLAGFENVSGKIIRSRNQIANAYGVIKALQSLKKLPERSAQAVVPEPQEAVKPKIEVKEAKSKATDKPKATQKKTSTKKAS